MALASFGEVRLWRVLRAVFPFFPMTRKEYLLLFTLACVQFTNIMDFMVMMPLGPILRKIFEISAEEFGWAVAAYNIAAGISGFSAAFYLDRFDRKRTLMVIYTGFVLGTLACAMAPSYELLLLARGFTGLFGGVLNAIVLSIVGDAIVPQKRGRAIGIVMASFSAAAAFGVPFGSYFAATFSWHFPFYFLALLGVGVLLMVHFFVPALSGHIVGGGNRNPLAGLQIALQDRDRLLALLLMFCMMMGQFSVIPYISDYMVQVVGLKVTDIPVIYLTGGVATIFTAQLIGRLADRFRRQAVFAGLTLLSLLAIAAVTNMPVTSLAVVLCGTTPFFIFISGRSIPATALITTTVHPAQRGSFMSVVSSVQQLASGLAVPAAGYIMQGDYGRYPLAGLFAITASLLAIVVGFLIHPMPTVEPAGAHNNPE